MGTKRTNRTIEDSLQLPRSPATPDRGNQSNEWISREARPQAGPKIQVERERGGDEWRAREMDRMRDRQREGRRDVEQDQRENERYAQFKGRADEMDPRDRDRRREDGRYTNGKASSIQPHVKYRERDKGDTFPRTVRPSNERERRPRHSVDQSSEKLMDRGIERPREIDMIEIERQRERAKKRERDIQRYREMEWQRENERRRIREETKRNTGRRLEEKDFDRIRRDPGERERRGERYTEVSEGDQQILRRQERDRYRDRPRDREDRYYSPQTRRIIAGDREILSDREERDERRRAVLKERHRYAKSEGDTDGEKEREVTREGDAVLLDGTSENEKERIRDRLRERERRREVERQKERDRRKEKETTLQSPGREGNKEWTMDRYRERDMRERDWAREERGPDRQRDRLRGTEDRKREKELNERMRREHERERARIPPPESKVDMYMEWADRQRQNCYAEETTGRSSQTQRGTDRKIQEEAQSNREWMPGSDVEGDKQRRRTNSFEEKGRKSTSESDGERNRSEEGGSEDTAYGLRKEEVREGSEKEETEMEREKDQEKSESKKRPHRKMWLEPRTGRERTESLQEDFKERQQARERYAQRFQSHKTSRGEDEMPTERKNGGETILLEDSPRKLDSTAEFMNDIDTENLEEGIVSDEMVFESEALSDVPWQTETENVADDMEGSDREEEQGSDRYGNSEGEEESEGAWEDWRDRVISGDDGFVTVSSGAEEDETEEDRFEDCTEFWEGEDREGLVRQSPTSTHQIEGEVETRMTKERSDHAVTVFCVVGQTLPRSRSDQNPLLDHMEQDKTSQDSSCEVGVVGGDQHEAPNRDTEAETSTDPGLNLSEDDTSSSHDTKCDIAESDQMTKEVTASEDLVISADINEEKDNEQYPTESIETLTQTEDHGNAQMKTTDGENQVEGQNEMESSCHLEEAERTEDRKRFSAAPHVKWAKNVLSEILGSTEESGTLTVPEESTLTEQAGDGAPAEAESQGDSPLYGIVQKPRKHSHTRKCIDPEMHFEPEDAKIDIVVGNEIQVEGQSDGEEELEQLSTSPDLLSFSSDNETDKEGSSKKEKKQKKAVWKILGTNSFRELGNEVWGRKAGIRRTLQKHNEEEEEEGEGVGRDRRTRVFTTDNAYDDMSISWNELDLRTMKGTLSRTKMRTSKFYNSQLYQQYSEVVQNRELIHHQSHSDTSSVSGDHDVHARPASTSPSHSPTLARRPLPPLPPVFHSHSLSHANSVSSGNGLLSVPHNTNQRPTSPRLSKSFASSPMLWQDLPGVRNNPKLKLLSEDEKRLQEVRFEVVTSESSYCSSLDIVVEHFVKCKQLNILLTSQDKNWLFSKLSDVRAISHSFFSQLEERVESDIMYFNVCDIIIKHCPRFRAVYVPYLTNQSYQDKTYQRLMNENSGFRQIVEKLEQSPKCQRLPLRSFLILPFQRITRLKLLVQNILKRTIPKTKDEAQAIKAMKLLEKMIQDSNDSISQMKNIESLVSLNAKVDFECKTLPLISQARRLVKEGQVSELRDFILKEKERSIHIHLFNDYLLLSLPKEGGRFTVIDHAPVSELRAENCRVKLHSLHKNLFLLHIAQRSLLLRTETTADKLRWISALSRPHPEIDFTAAQDIPQMQCIRAFVAQQPDELSLEKADVLLVHQQSNDGWVEGTRLSDRLRGWVPESHLETIVSEKARQRNLIDTLKITTATATA
ncbi:trichohyalin isoform X1 [Hemibagrus wyckioides]|nr:trichohyalin isoform X1 [Hemibagrus wyckioides]XP_058247893.1 trichohyalin isoform X1 [Hemibagrus wyckioides]